MIRRSIKFIIARASGPSISSILWLIAFSCASQNAGTSSESYHEDLSVLRPKFSVTPDSMASTAAPLEKGGPIAPTAQVNAKVDEVLDSLDRLNQLRKFVDGFTIQIYSGQNREEAVNAKQKMLEEVDIDLVAKVEYSQPKFRVTAGQYFSKLEAQKDLQTLRRYFSSAILVPEKVRMK